jgi:hypothetical protein
MGHLYIYIYCVSVCCDNGNSYFNLYKVIGRLVKLLLVFASAVIPVFSLLEIHDQDIYSLLDMRAFRNGASSAKEDRCFYVGATFVAPQFQHEYIRAVTAPRSLWALCMLCHCTILSNLYTSYTEILFILNDIWKFTGNTLRLRYKGQKVNAV